MNRLILSAPNYVKSLLLFTLHCSYNFKFLSLYDIFDKWSMATSSLHTALQKYLKFNLSGAGMPLD